MIVEFIDALTKLAHTWPLEIGLIVLLTAVLIEYVLPPFPGDTLVLFGFFLTGTGAYPLLPTFLAVCAGGVAGSTVAYAIGRHLDKAYRTWAGKKPRPRFARSLARVERVFLRWGDWLILANRFFPGIRGVFFLAAGIQRRSLARVLSLGFVSLVAWNGLILAVGYVTGSNWHRMRSFLTAYGKLAGGLVLAIITIWIVAQIHAWRKTVKTNPL